MPVQKALSPAAVTMTARTSRSSRMWAQVAAISSHMVEVNALWRSARSSVIVATPSAAS
jgi:hypothetical protein